MEINVNVSGLNPLAAAIEKVAAAQVEAAKIRAASMSDFVQAAGALIALVAAGQSPARAAESDSSGGAAMQPESTAAAPAPSTLDTPAQAPAETPEKIEPESANVGAAPAPAEVKPAAGEKAERAPEKPAAAEAQKAAPAASEKAEQEREKMTKQAFVNACLALVNAHAHNTKEPVGAFLRSVMDAVGVDSFHTVPESDYRPVLEKLKAELGRLMTDFEKQKAERKEEQ